MIDSHILYLTILSSVTIFLALTLFWILKLVPANLAKWEKLPRNVLWGMIIAVIDLAICVPQSEPIVPTGMKPWLIPLAVISAWIVYQFLDYIFSRAFGGALILLSYYLLFASFTYHTPAKIPFALGCYGIGILGIFFCGKPFLMRDLIRKIANSAKWRNISAIISTLYTILFLIITVLEFLKLK